MQNAGANTEQDTRKIKKRGIECTGRDHVLYSCAYQADHQQQRTFDDNVDGKRAKACQPYEIPWSSSLVPNMCQDQEPSIRSLQHMFHAILPIANELHL